MARITVEDCIGIVPNRFELVLLAERRARDINAGAPLTIPRYNDKNPVVALREISANRLPLDKLRKSVVTSMQNTIFIDSSKDFEEEITDEMTIEDTWDKSETFKDIDTNTNNVSEEEV